MGEVEATSIKRGTISLRLDKKTCISFTMKKSNHVKNIPGVKRIRFYDFGQSYLTYMKCLENVGLLRTDAINFNGQDINRFNS